MTEAAQQLTTPDAADQALEAVSTHATMALIKSLPPDQAEIIMLRVVAGLDTGDVARIVGKSPGAVRVAAHRGLRLAGPPGRAGGCNALSGSGAMQDEMPGFFPGLPGGEHDEPLLDMILERRPIPPGAPPEIHGLARMLAAVAGPAEPGDLVGQAAAQAAFTRLASPPGTSSAALRSARRSLPERPARGRLPLAVALVAVQPGWAARPRHTPPCCPARFSTSRTWRSARRRRLTIWPCVCRRSPVHRRLRNPSSARRHRRDGSRRPPQNRSATKPTPGGSTCGRETTPGPGRPAARPYRTTAGRWVTARTRPSRARRRTR